MKDESFSMPFIHLFSEQKLILYLQKIYTVIHNSSKLIVMK